MNHVRKTKRGGAPVTNRDLTESEARRDLRWVTCPKCKAIMKGRSER